MVHLDVIKMRVWEHGHFICHIKQNACSVLELHYHD